MSITLKIIFPIIVVILAILGIFIYFLDYLRQQEAYVDNELVETRELNQLCEKLSIIQKKIDYNVLQYLYTKDASLIPTISDAVISRPHAFEEISSYVNTPTGIELIGKYKEQLEDIEPMRIKLLETIGTGNKEEIDLAYYKWSMQTLDIDASLTDFKIYNINTLQETQNFVNLIGNQIAILLIILFLLITATLFLLIIFLRELITKRIAELVSLTDKIALKDFSVSTEVIDVNSNDEIGKLANSFRDMTLKLKEYYTNLEQEVVARTSELNKFKLIVAFSTDGIIMTTPEMTDGKPDPKIIYVNPAWEKMTGYKLKEVLGRNPNILHSGKTPQKEYIEMWKALPSGKAYVTEELINRRKDGQEYKARINIFSVTDDETNAIEFYVGIEQDITERKMIENQKTEFVSVASHQLRTPLGIIKWYLEILVKMNYFEKAPGEFKKNIDVVYKSNERVLNIVRELLSVSRIDQKRIKDKPEQVDIKLLVSNIIDQMQIIAHERKVNLKLEIKQNNIPLLFIDSSRLIEVIENLIENAICYNKESGSVLVIIDIKGDRLLIQIKDTGIGITPEDKKKLFSKFFRSQEAMVTNTEGSGLGLYIAKSYVGLWKGQIEVESEHGKGATFSLYLPIQKKPSKTEMKNSLKVPT